MEKPLHILIIEDNESDAALIVRHLTKADFQFTYELIENAPQLSNALQRQPCDLVICDFTLPQFDALNALKMLKFTDQDTPFIVVSGTIGEETAIEIMKAGAHDYIMKENFARLIPVINRELAEAAIRREHRQAEEQIRMQAHLLDLIGQSVITIDRNNLITYWNKASELLYGWTTDEVIGQKLTDVIIDHAPSTYIEEMMEEAAEGEYTGGEFVIQKKDGSLVPIQVTTSPIFDDNGLILGTIGISFDISERKKNEDEMVRKIEELNHSNQELLRMNRLTIGREIRMIELKQHCNSLAKQLGIKQPYPLIFKSQKDHESDK